MKKLMVITTLLALPFVLIGCSNNSTNVKASVPAPKKTAVVPTPEPVDLQKVKPNELGKVLILEYHDVGPKEERWTRQHDNFRADLERLHKLGYYPISLRDYVNNNINVPAGKSPIIFTFDDGTLGQFNYINEDGEWKIDPNCAVAIMEEFNRQHPDFPLEATFYVYYPLPFRQKELIERKIRHIVKLGMDIGNHTYTHTRLDLDSDTNAAKEMALNVKSATEYAPDAVVDSIALPYGKGPRNKSVLVSGDYQGSKYHNIAALLVGAEPAPSPVSPRFDPYRLPRVQAIQSELDMWLSNMKTNRYISDGDPDIVTVAKDLEGQVDKAKLGKKKLRTY